MGTYRCIYLSKAMVTRLSSGVLMFIVGAAYFLLINVTLYPILIFVFKKINFTDYSGSAIEPVFS